MLVILVLLIFPLLLLSPRLAEAEKRFAIVIGANAGWANDRPLRYAEADAERIRDVLVELGGFSADRVTLLRDPETSEVRTELRRLAGILRATSEQTFVFVYYSGHSDKTHLHLRGSPMSYQDFETDLRHLPASIRVGVLDSCNSGSIASKGAKRVAAFKLRTQDESRVRGLVLLASSGADELSQESRSIAGSVFTHHLVSGLRGAADENTDEQVSLSELYNYTFTRTAADTSSSSAQQTPTFRFDLKGQGELTLSFLKNRLATLLLPQEESRRYVVVDHQEWKLIAESRSEVKRKVSLALAPGKYRLKRVGSKGIDVAEFEMQAKGMISAGQLAFETLPLSTGVLKGTPSDKNSEEYREWLRGKALSRLADGKASSAIVLFDELLMQWPGDWGAMRGRARGLIRLAESYDILGDREREQEALKDAIEGDPSLAQDPDFRSWYRRTEQERQSVREKKVAQIAWKKKQRESPRKALLWGFEFDIVSAKSISSVVASLILDEMWMPYLSIDLLGTGLAGGVRLSPLSSRWSPYVGVGGHLTFQRLGFVPEESSSKKRWNLRTVLGLPFIVKSEHIFLLG